MNPVDKFLDQPAEWLRAAGPSSEVVLSSRIRLARNLTGYPFEGRLTEAQRKEIVEKVGSDLQAGKGFKEATYLKHPGISDLDRQFLLERHLISREHAEENGCRAVAITPDETVSLMVLEEDHLRLQAFQSGLNLLQAWQMVDQLDTELEKKIRYAFSPTLGYLTACPTNLGTGLRASCMLHLPGLVLTKQIHKVLQALGKLNLAVRGLYGEGTQATGNIFQFSNQITLGQQEEEIIDNLECVIHQIIEHEKKARQYMREKKKLNFEDQIWRSVGTLKTARVISSQEATGHLSLLQLGFYLGMLKTEMSMQDLNALFLLIRPAHLQKVAGKKLDTAERDALRAERIRKHLTKMTL